MATATKKPTTKTLRLDEIRIDGGTQMRVELSESTIAEYEEIYSEGGSLPPVKVIQDKAGNLWLWEGFHRWHARKRAGLSDIKAEIAQGTQREAVLLACGANADHGLKRSNADKRRAVETLLKDKTWSGKANNWIAQQCKVSDHTVAKIRADLESTSQIRSCETREGQDGKERKLPERVESTPVEAVTPAQQQVRDFFKEKEPAPEPEPVKQHNVSFDPEVIENAPAPPSEASIVRDALDREIPPELRGHHERAANIMAAASKLDAVKREVEALGAMEGGEFLEVALILDTLTEVKSEITQARYWTQCPSCPADDLNSNCKLCDCHGFVPFKRRGLLTAQQREFLGLDQEA